MHGLPSFRRLPGLLAGLLVLLAAGVSEGGYWYNWTGWSGSSVEIIKVRKVATPIQNSYSGVTFSIDGEGYFTIEYAGGLTITGTNRGSRRATRLIPDEASVQRTRIYLENTLASEGGADYVELKKFTWKLKARFNKKREEVSVLSRARAKGRAYLGSSSAASTGVMVEAYLFQ